MSLFFGIFAKTRDLEESDWRPCVDELTHGGRRTLETRVTPRLVVAAVESRRELDAPRIADSSDSGSLLLLGGEVFDYEQTLPELQRRGRSVTDPRYQAAVLLHGYEEHGTSFLSDLTGAFAIAHHDPATGELTLASDPFGMHPLLVWETGEFCLFGSEIEPITRFPDFEPVLDEQAVSEYFAVEQPYGGRTFFSGIENLPPGTLLETDGGGRSCRRRYDDLAIQIDHALTLDDAVDGTFELLQRAVAARLRYRERALAALTGGLDTRLLVGLLSKSQRQLVEFRTIQETWMTAEEDTDFQIARQLADRFGLNLVVREPEGPGRIGVVDRSFLERLRILKGKAYKFEGFYGDNFLDTKWERPLMQEFIRHRTETEMHSRLGEFLAADWLNSLPSPLAALRAHHGQLAAEQQDYLYYFQRLTRAWFTRLGGGSPKGWVMPQRQVSHGLDSIFRDTALLRHLLTVPPELIRNRGLYERLYERCLPELCEIPTTRPGSLVPHAPRKQALPKKPRADYGPILAEYLDSSDTWSKGIYNEPRLRQEFEDKSHWAIPAFADFESWYRERFLPLTS